jgi:hypothetical protein
MRRHTTLSTLSTLVTAALAAAAVTAAAPASAEAVVYDTKNVGAVPPGSPPETREWASLDVPTGYSRQRVDWHTVAFLENVEGGRQILLDLAPEVDTVRELRAEREALKAEAGDAYHEHAFVVHREDGAKVTARWVYSYAAPGTEDVEPFTSVMLMGHNRLTVVGKESERKFVRDIRKHVVSSVVFPG